MTVRHGFTLDAPAPPTPGRIVRVRGRRYLVDDVVAVAGER
jgi:hypothetical protein